MEQWVLSSEGGKGKSGGVSQRSIGGGKSGRKRRNSLTPSQTELLEEQKLFQNIDLNKYGLPFINYKDYFFSYFNLNIIEKMKNFKL